MQLKRFAVFALAIVSLAFAIREGLGQIGAERDKSAGFFTQMMPVMQSPRCMNCHPATNFPRQGDDEHPHQMLVVRGPDDSGAPALRCAACHGSTNNPTSGVPGAADWHLAPMTMAWEGLSAGALCRLLLDPTRNGGMSHEDVVAHMRTPLVQWAWLPGTALDGRPRTPAPLTGAAFVELTSLWIASGAACPEG